MKLIFILPLLFSLQATASPLNSQKRFRGESFDQAVKRFYGRMQLHGQPQPSDDDAYMSRIPMKDVDDRYKARIPEYTSMEDLERAFEWSRDERFMTDPQFQTFLRRISWLYPDDGCFARAQVAQKIVSQHEQKGPLGKVFIFGSLVVKTENSPDGEVSWWYHVVPASRVNGQIWIFDAAIDPTHLMKLEEWISHMVRQGDDDFTVSFCKNETYGPSDSCMDPDTMNFNDALNEQSFYLRAERERLVELGRKADDELGQNPPWFTEPKPQPGKPIPPIGTPLYLAL